MNEESRPTSPTIRLHKRQVAWQIIIPFVLMAAAIIAAAVLVSFGEATPTALWRDVSLIWLLIPMLVLALILMILLGFLIYGLMRLKKAAPRATARAQELTLIGAQGVRKFADGAAKPFIWLDEVGAAIRSVFKHQRRS